jgi:hypothetical protein
VYDAFREAGGNFIDTANFYTNGTSESFLGEFMKDHRQSVVLATKYSNAAPGTDPNAAGNHRKSMVQAVEASLKRLQTDYIDLYWRTFVLGTDPVKLKLRDDIGKAFIEGKKYFNEHPDITSVELYRHAQKLVTELGWEYGGRIAGHLIGHFPHERIADDKVTLYVHPDNPNKMRDLGADGQERHWIFEIHFIDRGRQIGGFFEELLTVG